MQLTALRPCERDGFIQSLRAGVTSLQGARHIQVGRDAELAATEENLNHIAEGGSAFRLVIGEYRSGKKDLMSMAFVKRLTLRRARTRIATKRIHFETSFFGYLTSRPSRDLLKAAGQQLTLKLWDLRRLPFMPLVLTPLISGLGLQEPARGAAQAAGLRLVACTQADALAITPIAQDLGQC